MKVSQPLWKSRLTGQIPQNLAEEIDTFETEIELRSQDKLDEKVFAETRLRRGVYGQRYDNGQRSDGSESKVLPYSPKITKGPHTLWDAPGMQRIKIPFGGITPEQMELLADLAEEYSDGIAHVTTRQDIQLHFVHINDTPSLMRRLASVGITTREACGNSVRNVTGCPLMGVCRDEPFDVTPYADALTWFLLGHPDAQNFGRKFKPAFGGCQQHACGLTQMHDLGVTGVIRTEGGIEKRGFKVVVGGGLGAVPRQAKVFDEFLPPEELLPIAQAMARVFGRHGEKKTRSRARLKFLIEKWGIEKFREEVLAERAKLPHDPRWTSYLPAAETDWEPRSNTRDSQPSTFPPLPDNPSCRYWFETNVRPQKQAGYATVAIALPLGDITPTQLRALADIVREFSGGSVRTTVEQNFLLRWVRNADVFRLYEKLNLVGLAQPGASSVTDIVTCPGTDTCKLGISSSRGLASELRKRLLEKGFELDAPIRGLHIKISGCFNSCGQHHVADLGFYGVSRTIQGFKVPHFQVVIGGQWDHNAGAYGLPVAAIPSKRVPDALDKITRLFIEQRSNNETFSKFVQRIGIEPIRELLESFTTDIPRHEENADFYSDWGDPRQYSLGDIGKGECAGEVVSQYEFELAAAERLVFESQIKRQKSDPQSAGAIAYKAMIKAAKGLVQIQYDDVSEDDPQEVVDEFKERFFDNELFFDPFAGPKFANYLFEAHANKGRTFNDESARTIIEESQLFIEAVHSCYNRVRSQGLTKSRA